MKYTRIPPKDIAIPTTIIINFESETTYMICMTVSKDKGNAS